MRNIIRRVDVGELVKKNFGLLPARKWLSRCLNGGAEFDTVRCRPFTTNSEWGRTETKNYGLSPYTTVYVHTITVFLRHVNYALCASRVHVSRVNRRSNERHGGTQQVVVNSATTGNGVPINIYIYSAALSYETFRENRNA